MSQFNRENDYIDFDTDIDFQKNLTVSAWVKPTALNGNRSILGKGKALSVKIRDGALLFTSPRIILSKTKSLVKGNRVIRIFPLSLSLNFDYKHDKKRSVPYCKLSVHIVT